MAQFSFQPASREEIKAKLCLFGSSGSGKSVSSALVAYGLCGDWWRIAFADTEGDSAKQMCGQSYGDVTVPQGDESFRHCKLSAPFSTDLFEGVVNFAAGAREIAGQPNVMATAPADVAASTRPLFDVLVIESLSHAWIGDGGVLEQVDKFGKFEGWKTMTPRLRRMVDAIRFAPIHVVFTLRAATEYEIETADSSDGKKRVKSITKLGVRPQFREGIDYEATCGWRLDQDNNAWCDKDRTQLYKNRPPRVLGVADGRQVAEWCAGAVTKIGSDEWVGLRLAELEGYAGSLDGLATLWKATAGHRGRVKVSDWQRLVDAKDASKARLAPEGR